MMPLLPRLALIVALLSGAVAARADEFDTLRLKWRDSLTQGTNASLLDPLYSDWIASISYNAGRHWSTMATNAGRTFLWSDLNGLGSNSLDITATYSRLRAMALGYSVRGSVYQTNAAMLAALAGGLDWMHTNHYNPAVTNAYDNWFDWEIGVPLLLNDITVLVYSNLSAAQINNYMNAVNRFAPDPVSSSIGPLTGANEVWKASIVAVRGAIVKDSAKLAAAKQALSDVFPYVTSGDGFYRDGSFVFHDVFPYTGGYGTELIATIGPLMQFLSGSTWAVTDPAQTNLYGWIHDSFQPLLHRGAMMQMVSGRYFTRDGDDHAAGHEAIAAILRIAQFASPADAAAFKGMVRQWLAEDTFRDFITTQPPPYNVWAQAVLDDAGVAPRGELIGHYQFPHMDRAVHLRPGWALGLALSSSRIGNYESTRGENLRGWYTAEGMTYLYGADLNQFADGYWATVNPYRLPGTTVDVHTRTNGSGEGYLSPNNWTGGASLQGLYGVSGMHLNAWNSSLSARKSWFMFDNEIVCLGAGITLNDNRAVETIIDNRRLAGYGQNTFTADGYSLPSNPGWSATLTNATWLHLGGNVPGSDIGYYFPQLTTLNALREARSGSLSEINTTYGPTNRLTRHFLTLWLNHGVEPSNETYAYVLLPNRTPEQTAAYAAAPEIVVLENTTRAQAVRDDALGLTAINFWRDGSNRVSNISSDRRASVVIRYDGATLDIALSDPTQTNTGSINLEISGAAASVISADPEITVLQLSPVIRLAATAAGLAGRTVQARLYAPPLQAVTLAPVADAHVQNGDQANVNFGTAVSLGVKSSGASLARETFFRFDLSSVQGQLHSATLRIVPNTVEFPLYHALAFVTNTSWTELGLTWNTKPASGPEFTRWLAPTAGTPVLVPVEPLVQQALAADPASPKLSLRIYSTGTPPPTNGGYSSYASKENGASGNRPQILLNWSQIPPSVTLTSPAPGTLLDTPATVTLGAAAADPDGAIAAVDFYNGSICVARATTSPYSLVLSNLAAGPYTLTARATDNIGLIATSAPVSFTVHTPEPAGRGGGLLGEYYTNQNLTGIALTRTDQTVNFSWGNGSPSPQIPNDRFSARWTGRLQARRSGLHIFHTTSDEGIRLWVDGRLLIDRWAGHSLTEHTARIALVAGAYYDISLEYFDETGGAAAQLHWTQPGGAKEVIPQAQLYAANTGLRGTYFAGTNLVTQSFTRIDHTIDFSWVNSSPDPTLLPGSYSARWNGKVRTKQAGAYTFYTLSDDGVRLTANSQLIISNWTVHSATLNSNTVTLAGGQLYNVALDYFNHSGTGRIALLWAPPGELPHVIPEANLTPFQNNFAPALAAVPDAVAIPGELLTFTAVATDVDSPPQTLSYTLDVGAPSGATIHPGTGVFTWTPAAAFPPGNYSATVRVTDNGVPAMTDAQTFTLTVVSNAATTPVLLVQTGSVWRYLDNGSDQDEAWRGKNFSDAGWPSGRAPLGYGIGGEGTVVSFGPSAANKYITTYFRRAFQVPDPALVQSLTARLLRDDGVIVFLNGTEVWRDNLPAGNVGHTTTALAPITGAAKTNFLTQSLNPSLLVSGTNVLAVEIHQAAPNGADIRFDLDLGGVAIVPLQTALGIVPSQNGVALTWPAEAGLFRLFTTTNLSAAVWVPATNTPVLSNGLWIVELPFGTNRTQFYRLQTP